MSNAHEIQTTALIADCDTSANAVVTGDEKKHDSTCTSKNEISISADVVGSRQPTPIVGSTKEQIWKARIQLVGICYCLFLAGWNDGANGPLIPRMQSYYHLSYSIVSLVFVGPCIGFLIGAVLNIYLTDKIGFGKVILLGAALQIIAYAVLTPAPPFPVLVIMYAINGIGIAMQDSQANAFVASVRENKPHKMGLIHAVYGFGALCSPLVSTQFSKVTSNRWAFHYLCSLVIALINIVVLGVIFRGKSQRECLEEANQLDPVFEEHGDDVVDSKGRFKQIFYNKLTHLFAFFSFVYIGVEVMIGGWSVSYIIEHRNGGPSSGYISSGYFGGLTAGRILLIWINQMIGERRVVFIYAFIAILLEIVVYVVPNLIINAVAVSFIGFVLGPMYPILMNIVGGLIAPASLPGTLGWTVGMGTIGSALLPFGAGALAQRYGIASLQPFSIALTVFMLCLWALIAKKRQRLSPSKVDTPTEKSQVEQVVV